MGWPNDDWDSLQDTGAVDKDIALIIKDLSGRIPDLDIPLSNLFIPTSVLNRVFILDVPLYIIFSGRVFHIIKDLLRSGIIVGPLGIGCERVRIVVRWNVALTSRISNVRQSATPLKAHGSVMLAYRFNSQVPPRS